MEENNKWRTLVQKRWFFPALYLTIAALLLTIVIWYQNMGDPILDAEQEEEETVTSLTNDEEAESVSDQTETVMMPIAKVDEAKVVTKFFDYDADEEDQQAGLILHNNRYYQSTGVSIQAEDEESFDVVSALSGEVKEVKEDPLLGNIVVMSHVNDVETYYASLGEVFVEAGDQLEQGEKIASAGKNLFTKDNGTHVHFEIHKDGIEVNPEAVFNQSLSIIDELIEEKNLEKTVTDEDDSSLEEDDETSKDDTAQEDEEDENKEESEDEKSNE